MALKDILKPGAVRRTLKNAFSVEVNKMVTFSSEIEADDKTVTIIMHEGDVEHQSRTFVGFNERTGEVTRPQDAIYTAIAKFKNILKDKEESFKLAQERAEFEAEKAKFEQSKGEATNVSDEPAEVEDSPVAEVYTVGKKEFSKEEWTNIMSRIDIGQPLKEVAEDIGVPWQSLASAKKKYAQV